MNKDEIIKRLQEIIDELKKEDTTEEQAAELQEEARGLKEKLKGINAQERKQKIADEIDKGLIDVRKISDDDKRKAEVDEVVEFYVDDDNNAKSNVIYSKTVDGKEIYHNPTKYLLDYLEAQGIYLPRETFIKEGADLKETQSE